jgi:aryl-alcohol dehydrogenase-like predicted oxidoreductase
MHRVASLSSHSAFVFVPIHRFLVHKAPESEVLPLCKELGIGFVPIFGTRRLDRVKENLGAAEVSLSAEEMAANEARLARIQVTGERLPAALFEVTYR